MRLDTNDDDFAGLRRGEVGRDRGDPHAEACFVDVCDGVAEVEFGAGGAEAGGVLGGGVDGDGEDGGDAEEFLGGEDYFIVVPYRGAEFLLDVADE